MARGITRIRWFRRHVSWGTVYLTCDETHPRRVKLGFTQRKTIDRRKELARSVEGRLVIVHTVQMPHAFALEYRCHKAMRGLGDRDFGKTSEWYVLRDDITLDHVIEMLHNEAKRLRLIAKIKLAWPSFGKITAFDSGWRSGQNAQPIKSEIA